MVLLEDRGRVGHIVRAVELSGDTPAPDAVRDAAARVQLAHEILQVTISNRDADLWFASIPDTPKPAVTVVHRENSRTVHDVVEFELNRPFPRGELPWRISIVLRDGDPDWELVTACHHCIADGRSLALLSERIILAIGASPTEDASSPRLVPPAIETIASLPIRSYIEGDRIDEFVRRQAILRSSTREFVIPSSSFDGPSRTSALRVVISMADERALHAWCRRHRVTAHAAIGAALLLGGADVLGSNGSALLTTTVDLRRFATGPASVHEVAMYSSGVRTAHAVANTGIEALSLAVAAATRDALRAGDALASLLLQEASVDYYLQAREPAFAWLSSLGLLSQTIGHRAVRGAFGGVPVHAYGPMIYVQAIAVGTALSGMFLYPDPLVDSLIVRDIAIAWSDRLRSLLEAPE